MARVYATEVGLAMASGFEYVISAVVCGQWAAHLKINSFTNTEWTITHVPSGKCLPVHAGEEAAINTIVQLSPIRISGVAKKAGQRVKRIAVKAGCTLWTAEYTAEAQS